MKPQRRALILKLCVTAIETYGAVRPHRTWTLDEYVAKLGAAFGVTKAEAAEVLNMRLVDLYQPEETFLESG